MCVCVCACVCVCVCVRTFPSQAVVVDRTVYVSGQLGMDPQVANESHDHRLIDIELNASN